MARRDPSSRDKDKKDKRKGLRAHFDEDNIRKTRFPEKKDYGIMPIDEPKTPFPRTVPPVDPTTLRARLNAEIERRAGEERGAAEETSSSHAEQSRNAGRNAGGRSEYLARLYNRHEYCRFNEQMNNEGNSEFSVEIERSNRTSSTTGPSASSLPGSIEQGISMCESFEERRRRFYAQEYRIAKQMLESCHELDEH